MWKRGHFSPEQMVYAHGDPDVSPTRWWWKWFQVFFLWRTVVTFRLPEDYGRFSYFVGFEDSQHNVWYKDEHQSGLYFSMRIGHEDCKFFAMHCLSDGKKKFIPIEQIARSTLH